jgi:TolA-binding protein
VSRARFALLDVLVALGGASLAAHPNSISHAQMTIGKRSITAVVRLPLDDVDLLLRIDRDLDGRVSASEIAAARPLLSSYIAHHFHVSADSATLAPAVGALTTWRDAAGFEYLEAGVTVDAGRPLRVVSIRSDYLTELYPGHSTQADITAGGRTERFVFHSGAAYERRVADERWTAPAIGLGAVAVLALLWLARRRSGAWRFGLASMVFLVSIVSSVTAVRADVIMTAAGLNTTLKTMERLKQQMTGGSEPQRADATFQLGAQADALATLMNEEVASHGMEQRELLDLALSRTRELGIAIAYNRDKKKFFYDGTAFRQYLSLAPRGSHAPNAEFTLLAYQFYQSDGTDIQQLQSAAEAKKRFLVRYPKFKADAELSLYLAVDYSDLYRRHRDAHDAAAAERYRQLTRAEYQRIARQYPGTEQAQSARQLLRRFDEETRPRS